MIRRLIKGLLRRAGFELVPTEVLLAGAARVDRLDVLERRVHGLASGQTMDAERVAVMRSEVTMLLRRFNALAHATGPIQRAHCSRVPGGNSYCFDCPKHSAPCRCAVGCAGVASVLGEGDVIPPLCGGCQARGCVPA